MVDVIGYITARECLADVAPTAAAYPLQAALIGGRVEPSGDGGADLKAAAALQIADVMAWATHVAAIIAAADAARAAVERAASIADAEVVMDGAVAALKAADSRGRASVPGRPWGGGERMAQGDAAAPPAQAIEPVVSRRFCKG
jgi:hypothetical protein